MDSTTQNHIENAIDHLEVIVEDTRSISAGVKLHHAKDEINSAVNELFDSPNHMSGDHPLLTAQYQIQSLIANHLTNKSPPKRNFIRDSQTPEVEVGNMIYHDTESLNEVVPVILDLLEACLPE